MKSLKYKYMNKYVNIVSLTLQFGHIAHMLTPEFSVCVLQLWSPN